VHIDETGCEGEPFGINGAVGGSVDAADLHDETVAHRNVRGAGRGTGAIHYGATPNDQVVHDDRLRV